LYKWQVKFAAHIQVEEVKNADSLNENPRHFVNQANPSFTLYRRKVNAANYLPPFVLEDGVIESMKRINYKTETQRSEKGAKKSSVGNNEEVKNDNQIPESRSESVQEEGKESNELKNELLLAD